MRLFDKKIDERISQKEFLSFVDFWFFINKINITKSILFVTYIRADAGREKTDKKILWRNVNLANEDEKSYKWDPGKKLTVAKKFQTLRLEESTIEASCHSARSYPLK